MTLLSPTKGASNRALSQKTYLRRDHSRSSRSGPTIEMAVNAPYASAAQPMVLRVVDALFFIPNLLSLRLRFVFLRLHLLLVVLTDIIVDAFRKTQLLVDIARARFVRRRADGEILLCLPFQTELFPLSPLDSVV
jgi:hypothetical protein